MKRAEELGIVEEAEEEPDDACSADDEAGIRIAESDLALIDDVASGRTEFDRETHSDSVGRVSVHVIGIDLDVESTEGAAELRDALKELDRQTGTALLAIEDAKSIGEIEAILVPFLGSCGSPSRRSIILDAARRQVNRMKGSP